MELWEAIAMIPSYLRYIWRSAYEEAAESHLTRALLDVEVDTTGSLMIKCGMLCLRKVLFLSKAM